MKVKATRLGFYDYKRRKACDVFILHNPKDFSPNWMVKLDGKLSKGKKEEVEEQDQSVDFDSDVI